VITPETAVKATWDETDGELSIIRSYGQGERDPGVTDEVNDGVQDFEGVYIMSLFTIERMSRPGGGWLAPRTA
jgi:hypothetical protein